MCLSLRTTRFLNKVVLPTFRNVGVISTPDCEDYVQLFSVVADGHWDEGRLHPGLHQQGRHPHEAGQVTSDDTHLSPCHVMVLIHCVS